jgi:hypothetical protein
LRLRSPEGILAHTSRRALITLSLAATVSACSAATARGSVWITNGAPPATLSADAAGNAEVAWQKTMLRIPLAGKVVHAALGSRNVSRPASVSGLPFSPTVRRTPSGWSVALQRWDVAGQTPALHLARWKGAPTKLTLTVNGTHIDGTATFQGRPVTGSSPTPTGTQMRIYVYLECFACPAAPNGWSPMLGVTPKADGTFQVLLRPEWMGSRYRASVEGPNIGATLAPDAQAYAPP